MYLSSIRRNTHATGDRDQSAPRNAALAARELQQRFSGACAESLR
jgi:hypothetical protein